MNARSKQLDQALSAMHATREPGRCYSVGEIAEGVGCHERAIEVIEQNALRKLKVRLQAVGLSEQDLHG